MTTFVQARWFLSTTGRHIDYVVLHDMEAPEKATTAESVALYFHTTSRKASAHYCVDADSIVQCVRDQDIAFHAPPNAHSIGVEHAGFARQSTAQWLDAYGRSMLRLSTQLVAELCHRYDLPVTFLTADDLRAGRRGITTHAEVSKAFGQSTHTDPGPSFPIDIYMAKVRVQHALWFTPSWWTRTLRRGMTGDDVRTVQRQLGRVPTGRYDWRTWWSVRGFQKRHDMTVSGHVNRRTALKLDKGGKP